MGEYSSKEPPPSVPRMASFSAPIRWACIPFDILDDWQSSSKKRKQDQLLIPAASQTHISDIPEPLLAAIFRLVSDVRTRNSMALVCSHWYSLERATRLRFCLRGNASDLYLVPRSFQAVEHLDLSQCSPWGCSLFQSVPERALLIGLLLQQAFPRVQHIIAYVRDARDIEMVACFWPDLQSITLVRWHQRPILPEETRGPGMEFLYLMRTCRALQDLDLSQFYCWTEDIPPALQMEPDVSSNLRSLKLSRVSGDGFKASEVAAITNACRNLEDLQIVLVFDPHYLDFVGDATLLQIATDCKKLRVLQLLDSAAADDIRGEPKEGFAVRDAPITVQGLVAVFQALPSLEDLKFILSLNVRDAAPALEALATHCKKLTSLSLGHFHGLDRGPPQPGGITSCRSLKELMIRNCADLDDAGMAGIANGCTGLHKLGLQSCKEVSRAGLRALAHKLQRTLKDVKVSCCLLMNAVDTLWALQPIQGTIDHLHVDCLLDADFAAGEVGVQEACRRPFHVKPHATARRPNDSHSDDGNIGSTRSLQSESHSQDDCGQVGNIPRSTDLRCSLSVNEAVNRGQEPSASRPREQEPSGLRPSDVCPTLSSDNSSMEDRPINLGSGIVCKPGSSRQVGEDAVRASLRERPLLEMDDGSAIYRLPDFSLDFCSKEWTKLKSLSLWIPVSESLSPLPRMGLQVCPSLQEVQIKVEGDSRMCHKPRARASGISTLASYPMLRKLSLDCSEVVGYALSAPLGHMELSLWERWYLQGIQSLKLSEFDYWPPQDRDANRRGLSLPGAGLISQCVMLRKLILHGTINEHLLKMFLNIHNLRDVQLRIDYYPAPDIDLNTEMRADACKRFEVALAEHLIPD